MTNYEYLKTIEESKQKIKSELTEAEFNDIETEYDVLVKCESTGQEGYVELYMDSTDVCFIVPKEDLTEYRITKETFNQDFILKK